MIKRILATLWAILTFPVRVLTWPFRRIRDFIQYEPEDSSTPDTIAQVFQQPSVLIEHVEALRKHLLRAILALIVTIGISLTFASQILDWLARPIGGIGELQAIEVTESIGAFMRVSLLSGFALALPYISFEVFSFVNPGLKRNERILVLFAMPAAFVLFVAGLGFAYYVMLPVALPFLLNFMGITTVPRPSNYIRFVTNLMFWIGMSFQFPLVIYTLAGLGFVQARTLARGWRIAIVLIAILAAAITPTIDPVNMALVMGPMVVLYFLSILLAAIAGRGRSRKQPAD